jgi:hypothetical protein
LASFARASNELKEHGVATVVFLDARKALLAEEVNKRTAKTRFLSSNRRLKILVLSNVGPIVEQSSNQRLSKQGQQG